MLSMAPLELVPFSRACLYRMQLRDGTFEPRLWYEARHENVEVQGLSDAGICQA